MKKRMSKIALVTALTVLMTASCSTTPQKEQIPMQQTNQVSANIIDDNYRTCYEIFVYSFYDSDGDGIGDLKGVEQKLDYLNDGDDTTDTDLGVNEVWLMPINSSTTYHKYDVVDYYEIDKEYGSMEDFDQLVASCHERGIHVIIDFVMNHTSSKHEWFQTACQYLEQLPDDKEPDLNECPYVDYYNFSKENLSNYYRVGNSNWYYEGKFWSEMPDLNLKSEAVRKEFSDIAQFWIDHGVDGFRLDATGEYYSSADQANVDVLSWFNEMVKEKKPDAYLVGEAWMQYLRYSKYYVSGIDSMFNFAFADYDGYIAKVLNGTAKSGASTYGLAIEAVNIEIKKNTDTYIDAPFYTNHDMGRGAGYYAGDDAESKTKLAQAMNLFMSGNAFLYYGEELGMIGSGKDENKRLGMLWNSDKSSEGMCKGPIGAEEIQMRYPSLEEQKEDPYSIYNYIKQVIKLRNAYPEIAHGEQMFEKSISNDKICAIRKTYENEELLILYNTSNEETEVDLSQISINGKSSSEYKEAGMLQTGEEVPQLKDGSLSMPAYSVILIK